MPVTFISEQFWGGLPGRPVLERVWTPVNFYAPTLRFARHANTPQGTRYPRSQTQSFLLALSGRNREVNDNAGLRLDRRSVLQIRFKPPLLHGLACGRRQNGRPAHHA